MTSTPDETGQGREPAAPVADLTAEGFLSVEDAAEFAAIGKSQLYGLMRAGTVALARLGTRRVVSKASLRAWLASNLVRPAGE